jgi:hypothetical protein
MCVIMDWADDSDIKSPSIPSFHTISADAATMIPVLATCLGSTCLLCCSSLALATAACNASILDIDSSCSEGAS